MVQVIDILKPPVMSKNKGIKIYKKFKENILKQSKTQKLSKDTKRVVKNLEMLNYGDIKETETISSNLYKSKLIQSRIAKLLKIKNREEKGCAGSIPKNLKWKPKMSFCKMMKYFYSDNNDSHIYFSTKNISDVSKLEDSKFILKKYLKEGNSEPIYDISNNDIEFPLFIKLRQFVNSSSGYILLSGIKSKRQLSNTIFLSNKSYKLDLEDVVFWGYIQYKNYGNVFKIVLF